MNSAYNQMPLDEQSGRLTQFAFGNQQYEFNRLFNGISIGPAAFSAFMSKIFRPLLLKKNAITYLDDVFMQSQTKEEMFTVLEQYQKILPRFSKFYRIYNQERKHLKPLLGNIYIFSIKQVHQYNKSQNKQQLFMSDFEFKPIHKFFKITISSIKYLKNTNSDIISLPLYNNTPYQITIPLGFLGYCETNATISPINEVAYRVNNILQLLDICQSTILDEELSINNIISNKKKRRLVHKNTIF